MYRLGKAQDESDEDRRPRPIVVGLKEQKLKEQVLQNCHQVRKHADFQRVYIDPDLTRAQIQDDIDMRNEATKRTESGNGEWKAKGRKGLRRLVKVKK